MIYQILSTNNCKLTWSSYNIPGGIVFYALMTVGYLVNVLLHKSNGGKSEKLNPPMYTYTNASTHMDNKVTTDDGADNDIKQR